MMLEDEEKKKKEELLSHFLKLKTTRESEKARFNELKIDTQWRALFRESKLKEFGKELDVMKQTFQKTLDHKDAMIVALDKELEESEVQYMWAVGSHLHDLDKLITIEQQRSEQLRQQYLTDLAEMEKYYADAMKKLTTKHEEEMQRIGDIDYTVKHLFLDKQHEIRSRFQLKMDKLEQMGIVEKQALRMKYESYVEAIWRQLQAALQTYLENTEERTKLFLEMKADEEKVANEIQESKDKIQTLKDMIITFKAKLKEVKTEHGERNGKLQKEKDALWKYAVDMKEQMKRMQEGNKASLIRLVSSSNGTIKELERFGIKADKILKFAECCKKLETKSDVSPLYESYLTEEELLVLQKEGQLVFPETLPLKELEEYNLLDKFWRRHNKVILQNLALARELKDLELDNQRLKSHMSKFLRSIAEGGAESISKTESSKTQARPVVQEAALLVKQM